MCIRDRFFTNIFSYADRRRLSQQAYRKPREELLRRYDELAPKLARHGVSINRAVPVSYTHLMSFFTMTIS